MIEPSPATNPVLNYLSRWSPLLLLLLGGLMAQFWNRFRTRMRRFTWKAWHDKIAIAANDPHWGNVTVQYNGVPVNHVHVTTVELKNDSSEDQKDVVVTLSFQDGLGQIIASTGAIAGSLSAIPLDQDYVNLFTGATPAQTLVLSAYVVHRIPVFNRGQTAKFTMLVVRNDASTPFVQASCNHPGVKLEFLPAGPQVAGVAFNLALGVGLMVTGAAILLLARYQRQHPYLNPIFCWFLGLCVTNIGADVVRGWKSIVRALG